MNNNDNKLVYVWDAYCGWCYGFSKNLKELHEAHPELELTILSGGLFTGQNKQPISNYPHIPGANDRINKITGAKFGEKYKALLEDGLFVLDSEAAARGFAALKYFLPERAYYLAADMQNSFYYEGKSLSDSKTYREIARKHNLDEDAVIKRFESKESWEEAQEEFKKVAELQVQSYPTLLFKKGEDYIQIGGGVMTADKMEAKLQELL